MKSKHRRELAREQAEKAAPNKIHYHLEDKRLLEEEKREEIRRRRIRREREIETN